ncbi:Relaxase/mobilization nuclease family protein (plasmid) [Shewanella baltica OS195]|uniref:Relaxase/mobilization nuclease family protein n=1 Tax=Shewanella baltica (strain OS195) TaxID=399599 RepID=A9L6P4_SHEB9|nr:TraI/MobA(P) family conjugative relaxase [Shewanella baltica]ABX51826.1 Relaxase/mobilization nuclease family protein [Shewanella baltica OS195]
MIAKHVPIRSLKKSDFANLANYITDQQSKIERVGYIAFNNCESANIDMAISEILAVQQMNTRTQNDKTYHLIVSFRHGENPSNEVLEDIELNICKTLGFEEHQRVSAVHYDTDNTHMHIAINKIHPEKLTIHEPFKAYKKLSDTCRDLEIKHGLEVDNHMTHQLSSSAKASDMEHHSGIESLVGWIKRICFEDMKAATNWEELHKVMEFNGLTLQKKGNGLVIGSIDSGVYIKASTLDRKFTKSTLESTLGAFEPPEGEVLQTRGYKKEPKKLKVDTTELYKRFLTEQQTNHLIKNKGINSLKDNKKFDIEMLKRSNKLKRFIISKSDNYLMRQVLYKQASLSMKANLKKINDNYKVETSAIYQKNGKLTWADWLKKQAEQGDLEALTALRSRKDSALKGNTFTGAGIGKITPIQANNVVTKGGRVTYQTSGIAGVKDDGQRLKIARDITAQGVISALRLAQKQYGNVITLDGTDEFKALVVKAAVVGRVAVSFSDPALEQQKFNLQMEIQNDSIKQRLGLNSSSNGPTGRRFADSNSYRSGDGADGPRSQRKSNPRSLRGVPPASRHNRLRHLSTLDVASIVKPSAVLLSSHARDNMDKQESRGTADSLRWGVFEPRLMPAQMAAADKYLLERMDKKAKGMDIAEHKPMVSATKATYIGMRNVDGQSLMLFQTVDSAIAVLPVIGVTKQFKVGEQVSVNDKGEVSRQRKMKR